MMLRVCLCRSLHFVMYSDEEIVCYNVGNALTDAKVRQPGPRFKVSKGAHDHPRPLPVPTPMHK